MKVHEVIEVPPHFYGGYLCDNLMSLCDNLMSLCDNLMSLRKQMSLLRFPSCFTASSLNTGRLEGGSAGYTVGLENVSAFGLVSNFITLDVDSGLFGFNFNT
uniref:Uncharacterized protein n=1 Tax=Physcomitrium patens TaxID=3218 RepID=A0A7I4FK33_PHYPA